MITKQPLGCSSGYNIVNTHLNRQKSTSGCSSEIFIDQLRRCFTYKRCMQKKHQIFFKSSTLHFSCDSVCALLIILLPLINWKKCCWFYLVSSKIIIACRNILPTMLVKRSHCIHSGSCVCTNGHLSETVLVLVFKSLNWNPRMLCSIACVCKWFEDIAKRILWKEFCLSRAPKMVSDLLSGGSHGTIDGNWNALGKLMIYCSGCHDSSNILQIKSIPGHFVYRTRFSRTSGKSFLVPQCRTDTLYVTDPCEHLDQGEDGDMGLFRGVFKAFGKSKVRKMLIERQVELHPKEICPYCRTKVWSMLQANMIPTSAYRRLGSYEDQIEYFICLNGHLFGVCTLLPLSDSETASEED